MENLWLILIGAITYLLGSSPATYLITKHVSEKVVWLDSIVVRCPLEHAEYGTRKRTLQ